MRLLLGLSLLVLVGCGDGIKLYPVSGTVTLDDKPMEGLLVGFAPDGGGLSGAGQTDAEGKYVITSIKGKGLPAGNYNVSITAPAPVKNSGSDDAAMATSSDSEAYAQQASGAMQMSQYRAAEKKKDKIPAKYNSQSTLKETIAETDNEIDFALSSR